MNMKSNNAVLLSNEVSQRLTNVAICYKPELKERALALTEQLTEPSLCLSFSESLTPDTSFELQRLMNSRRKIDWLLIMKDDAVVQVIDLQLNLSYNLPPENLTSQLLKADYPAIH